MYNTCTFRCEFVAQRKAYRDMMKGEKSELRKHLFKGQVHNKAHGAVSTGLERWFRAKSCRNRRGIAKRWLKDMAPQAYVISVMHVLLRSVESDLLLDAFNCGNVSSSRKWKKMKGHLHSVSFFQSPQDLAMRCTASTYICCFPAEKQWGWAWLRQIWREF